MAKSKKTRPAGPPKDAMQLKLQPNHDAPYPTAYANFASVSHTKDDLCIDFCLVAPPHRVSVEKSDRATGHVPVVSRVLIPVSMADGLIRALRAQTDKVAKEGGSTVLQLEQPGEKVH